MSRAVRASPPSSLRKSVAANALPPGGPGRRIFDAVEHREGIAKGAAEAAREAENRSIQLAAAGLIVPVENLIHHGDHPFLFSLSVRARLDIRRCGRWRREAPARSLRDGRHH